MAAAAGAELSGVETFLSSLATAARELDDLAPPEAGQLLLSRGEAAAPRDRGVLAAGHQVVIATNHVQVINTVDYAAIVHARHPWLAEVLGDAVPELLDIYTDHVADAVDHIKGV